MTMSTDKNTLKKAPWVNGSLLSFIYAWVENEEFHDPSESHIPWAHRKKYKVEMRENLPFAATLRYLDYETGRSTVRAVMTDEKGRQYPMFIKDFDRLLREAPHTAKIRDGAIWFSGDWQVAKRGSNYGLYLKELGKEPSKNE